MPRALRLILLSALVVMSPVAIMAEEMWEEPEQEVMAVTLTTKGRTVRVCGAHGKVLNIYDLAGVRVASYRIEGNDKTFDLNLSGCYILKVDKVVRKVSFR